MEPTIPREPGYSSTEAVKLAGISYRQLDYWDRTGLVHPSISRAMGSGTYRRYTEEDVGCLRAVRALAELGMRKRWWYAEGGPADVRVQVVQAIRSGDRSPIRLARGLMLDPFALAELPPDEPTLPLEAVG